MEPETQGQPLVSQPPTTSFPAGTDYHSRLASYTPKHLVDKIFTTRSALEGERRVVTVLFTDTAGFTRKLEGLLAELQTLEIIYRQGLLPEPAYIFKHAVIQNVAYSTLLIQRRKELHKAVAEAIEEL